MSEVSIFSLLEYINKAIFNAHFSFDIPDNSFPDGLESTALLLIICFDLEGFEILHDDGCLPILGFHFHGAFALDSKAFDLLITPGLGVLHVVSVSTDLLPLILLVASIEVEIGGHGGVQDLGADLRTTAHVVLACNFEHLLRVLLFVHKAKYFIIIL